MKFIEAALPGVFVIEPEPVEDERGFFARTFCAREFEQQGLDARLMQCSISFNPSKGTLRGMHYQAPPLAEAKLVRCTRGAIFDVVVDLRLDSPTYKQWFAAHLSAENYRALYIPQGLAHGFQTLADATEVAYQMSEYFHADSARGVRWDDPAFGIQWPDDVRIISAKDRAYPDFLA